jgi:hypothetical protein
LQSSLELFHPPPHQIQCVFHQFVQSEFSYGGLIFRLSQFMLQPQLPQKWS